MDSLGVINWYPTGRNPVRTLSTAGSQLPIHTDLDKARLCGERSAILQARAFPLPMPSIELCHSKRQTRPLNCSVQPHLILTHNPNPRSEQI